MFQTVPIAPMVDDLPVVALTLTGLAEENLQARVRGITLMGLSNEHGHLVLATGNKSELAVGYSTLYGDSVGGFAPIKDVPKTLVWRLARWRNADAEARGETGADPGGVDQQAAVGGAAAGTARHRLAAPLRRARRRSWTTTSSRTAGRASCWRPASTRPLVERVLRLTDRAEYKRRQYPPGPKISLQGVRSRPAAAHHQPLAGATRPAPDRRPAGGKARNWHVRDGPTRPPHRSRPRPTAAVRPLPTRPLPSRRASASGCTTCGR